MDKIIPLITTPLALAALVLLVFGGILATIFRTRGALRSETNRRAISWIFISVVSLSVLANISYLVQIFLFSEVVFFGNVRDSENNPVKFAFVDVQSVGRTATSDDGGFQISIPYSRQHNSYAIFSSAAGFSTYSSVLAGPRPEPRTIVLQKLTGTLDNTIQFSEKLTLTQDIGIPLISMMFKIGNVIGRPYIIEDLSLVLTQDERAVTLIPIYMKPLVSQFTLLPLHQIPAPPGSAVEIAVIWGQNQKDVITYIDQIAADLGIHPSDFCTKIRDLPANVTDRLLEIFRQRFFWKPGKYSAKMSSIVDGKRYERSFTFAVSEDLSGNLSKAREGLSKCFGIGIPLELPDLASLYVQDGTTTNFVQVPTQ
jgi:hypothetical protein